MNEEQMRKEFEELVVGMEDSHDIPYHLDRDEDDYVYKNTHDLWVGFKLSHQAMKPIISPKYYGQTTEKLLWEKAIKEAGYELKS